MFNGFGPRAKGGLQRLQQAIVASLSAYVIKGPPEQDFIIAAGDRPFLNPIPAGNVTTTGRSMIIQGGANTDLGVNNSGSNDRYANQGGVIIRGADSASNQFGLGGTVTIIGGNTGQAGGFLGTTGGADVTVQGGGNTSAANLNPGAANIVGGTGANGGAVNIKGGTTTVTNGIAGDVNITGGTPGTTGAAGNVFIAAGNANTTGAGKHVRLRGGAGAGGVNVDGNIQLDTGRGAAIATNAAGGFITIATCAGFPTGTPNSSGIPTGSVATIMDTVNLTGWAFSNSVWNNLAETAMERHTYYGGI